MMGFSSDIKKAREAMLKEADEYRKAVTISLFSSVIKDTPIDTGRLAGNWQTNEGDKKTNEIDRLDPNRAEAIKEAQDVVSKSETETTIHLTNNLPYSLPIENRFAMVARNMARIEQILRSRK